MNIETLSESILEKTTPTLTANLEDENGAPVEKTALATLTLTLYVKGTNTIINSRNAQDILDRNGVTVTETSTETIIEWEMETADTAVIGTRQSEEHRAVFEWTYGTPVKTGRHVIDMTVVNLEKVV